MIATSHEPTSALSVSDLLTLYSQQADEIDALVDALDRERLRVAECEERNRLLQNGAEDSRRIAVVRAEAGVARQLANLQAELERAGSATQQVTELRSQLQHALIPIFNAALEEAVRVGSAAVLELADARLAAQQASSAARQVELLEGDLDDGRSAARHVERLKAEFDEVSQEVSRGKAYERTLVASIGSLNDDLINARSLIAQLARTRAGTSRDNPVEHAG